MTAVITPAVARRLEVQQPPGLTDFQAEIQRALEAATAAHLGQFRKDNNLPYLVHPLEVLSLVAEWEVADAVVWQAALCHDVLEELPVMTPAQLAGMIGSEAASVCEELTFLYDQSSPLSRAAQKAEYLKTFLSKSLRALVVKCADRICNTREFLRHGSDYTMKYWRKADALFEAMISRSDEIEERYGTGVLARMKYSRDSLSRLIVR